MNNEIIESIEIALSLLKNNKLLFSYHLNSKIFFALKKDKILILSTNSKFKLSFEEFKELYKDASFIVYEDDEQTIDFARDDEYYSWKHK